MWDLIKNKLLGPVITAVIIAVLAFIVGIVGLPRRVGRLEKQTDKIPEIFETVGGFKSDLKNFEKASEQAVDNTKDFNNKLQALDKAVSKLEGQVDRLNGLEKDIRELRETINDLRTDIAKLPKELKKDAAPRYQEQTFEISALVFLTQENLKREGDMFVARLKYPERLVRGLKVKEIRTRLSAILPVPGLSLTTAFDKSDITLYNLLLSAQEPDAVVEFLKRQPIRVEVIFVIYR